MAIGLIGWGRFPVTDKNGVTSRVTVPAPSTDKNAPWLADYVRENAESIGSSFDFFQWPPLSKAQGGDGAGCDGYGVFDRYDLGTKPQQGSIPTRYGTLESVLSAISALNASGTQSLFDVVLHQLMGENGGPGVFRYLGADGTLNGRGATKPAWFRGGTGNNDPIPPFSPEDDVAGGVATDYSFGRELSYQHSKGLSLWAAKAYIQWLRKRLGGAGARYDDVKGSWSPAVRQIMDAVPDWSFYSEYFDSNPNTLNWWATSQPISERSAVEDFLLHYRIQAACNGFDASRLVENGIWGFGQLRPDLSVGFTENPDTDTEPGQQVIFNKGIAYALMLNLPMKLALVYGKDYFPSSVWPSAYGLKPIIDNIAWFSRMFAYGNFQQRWVDKDVYAFTRDGNGGSVGWSGGALVAANFNTWSARTLTVQTTWAPGTWIHDYSGHCQDATVGAGGMVTIHLPSNANSAGVSFGLFAPGGVNRPVAIVRRRTTHCFIGNRELDVMPALNGTHALPQRIHVKKGTEIDLKFKMDSNGVDPEAKVLVEVYTPAPGGVTRLKQFEAKPGVTATSSVIAPADGWYTLALFSIRLPPAGANFELDVTYTGLAE